ncbi:SDR family oxidoreductase [Amycolatopsis sp. NPDC006125]|uniref:SDR family oxidoreductase n=1 Tax=Amycolatopsis sp. NPDC006125 TaxID=3156730 RepID=UPI00339DEFA0
MTQVTTTVHVWGGSAALTAALSTLESPVPAACLAPDLPGDRDLEALSDELLDAEIGDVLAGVLAELQRQLPALSGTGRLVFLLPAEAALGRPHATAAGAVAGGVLSMARTLAIELARDGITVNTVLYAEGAETAVAHQVSALLAADGGDITGQEIYVTAGSGLGRLRP